MAWYVEHLLLRSAEIEAKADIEADDYNDLLIVEKELERLVKLGAVTTVEMYDALSVISSGSLVLKKDYLSDTFISVCNRIAFALGGVFTNEGYLYYLQDKYKLKIEELERLQDYMNSKYRHILRGSDGLN